MVTLANIMNNPTGLIILILVVVLLFGSQKIPELAKSIGQAKKGFEEGLKPEDDELRKERERETEIRRRVEEEMRAGK